MEIVSESVRVSWLGHSYFLLEGADLRIAIDPHDGGSLNLPEFRVEADYLLVTHNHYDHNAVEMVDSGNIVKWRRGVFRLGEEITVKGVPSYHDKVQGELRGPNTIYILDFGDLTIAHFGDLGHLPDSDLLSLIGRVNVALIPVGGVYTIDAVEAWELVQLLKPSLVIPMHYWTPYSTLPLDPLDRFLDTAKARRLRLDSRSIEVRRDELPDKPTIVVMPPPTRSLD